MIYLYHINVLKAESTLLECATALIYGSKFLSVLHANSSSEISLKNNYIIPSIYSIFNILF